MLARAALLVVAVHVHVHVHVLSAALGDGSAHPWLSATAGPPATRANLLLAEMTLDEKLTLLVRSIYLTFCFGCPAALSVNLPPLFSRTGRHFMVICL